MSVIKANISKVRQITSYALARFYETQTGGSVSYEKIRMSIYLYAHTSSLVSIIDRIKSPTIKERNSKKVIVGITNYTKRKANATTQQSPDV
jgi:hypothetical protein